MIFFTAHHLFPFPFRDVALAIWLKYPNEHSSHITSVDVLDRSFLPDGTIRTERLISISQHAPRWIMKLVGGTQEQYVREVIFYKVPSSPNQSPMVLMGSVNLTMSSILKCRENIRYQASQSRSTSFIQRAHIQAQGTLATGQSWAILGSRLESWSRDRFSTNAESGRLGFYSVLKSLCRQGQAGPCPDPRSTPSRSQHSINDHKERSNNYSSSLSDPSNARSSIRLAWNNATLPLSFSCFHHIYEIERQAKLDYFLDIDLGFKWNTQPESRLIRSSLRQISPQPFHLLVCSFSNKENLFSSMWSAMLDLHTHSSFLRWIAFFVRFSFYFFVSRVSFQLLCIYFWTDLE